MRHSSLAHLFSVLLLAILAVPSVWAQDADPISASLAPLRLTVEKAVELALAHNEAVRIADEGINEAKGTYLQYSADAFPQLSANIGYTRYFERMYSEVDMTMLNPLFAQFGLPPLEKEKAYYNHRHEWDFRVLASQNLFTFGKVSNAIRLGSVFKKVARVGKEITVADVAAQARRAFLAVLFLRESLHVTQSNLNLTQETRDVVKTKVDQGVTSRFELLVVESELAAAKTKVLQSERDLQVATQALLNVIGEPLDRETIIVGELGLHPIANELPTLINRAQVQRPALRALQLQGEMYDYSYRILRSLYLPTLSANGTYAQTGGSDARVFPEDPGEDFQPTLSFGVSLYVPLFDGLRSYGQMRQMAAKRHTAQLQYQQAKRGVELEVTSLYNRIQVTEDIAASNLKTVAVAEEAFNLAQLRFDNGLGTRLEVTEARNALSFAKLGLAATLFELNDAQAQLRRALAD